MNISEKFSYGIKSIRKLWLLPLIMLFMDLGNLLLYQWIYKIPFIPPNKIFIFKIGIIDTPPTIRYIFEDFPTVIFNYNTQYGITGIIDNLSLFNILLLLSYTLITSFITSGYLSCLEKTKFTEKVHIRYFFIKGNGLWFKFFILNLINTAPIVLFFIDKSFIMFSFIFVILYYVKFSIVIDGETLRGNFSKGIAFFFNNIGLSIKMAFYCGLIFIFISLPVFVLGNYGILGIVVAMVIVYYFGMAMNMMVLEVYRENSFKTADNLSSKY